MSAAIVIPARYESKRFPGKPLVCIKGKTLIQRAWEIGSSVPNVSRVIVATDDERIASHVNEFGGEALLTSNTCRNGTERVHESIATLSETPDIIVNLQGDAVLTPPWVIEELVDQISENSALRVATPAVPMSLSDFEVLAQAKQSGEVGGTLVVFSKSGRALYFSKAPIPFLRSSLADQALPIHRHIGIYAYRWSALQELVNLEPSQLELVEGLEQLRALENDIPVQVVVVDYRGRTHWGVDSPADAKRVEEIIEKEGELIQEGKS